MEIKIKKMGNARGTVGWLSAGLENGTLKIIESTMKANGNHGLWLKGHDKEGRENLSQFLAAYNRYNLSPQEYTNACSYETVDQNRGECDREGLWSEAAWNTLMSIAEQWCGTMNSALESEEPAKINISRIELQEVSNG